jgi:hypothetical protein
MVRPLADERNDDACPKHGGTYDETHAHDDPGLGARAGGLSVLQLSVEIIDERAPLRLSKGRGSCAPMW